MHVRRMAHRGSITLTDSASLSQVIPWPTMRLDVRSFLRQLTRISFATSCVQSCEKGVVYATGMTAKSEAPSRLKVAVQDIRCGST